MRRVHLVRPRIEGVAPDRTLVVGVVVRDGSDSRDIFGGEVSIPWPQATKQDAALALKAAIEAAAKAEFQERPDRLDAALGEIEDWLEQRLEV